MPSRNTHLNKGSLGSDAAVWPGLEVAIEIDTAAISGEVDVLVLPPEAICALAELVAIGIKHRHNLEIESAYERENVPKIFK